MLELETLVVTATRYEKRVESVPTNVTTITEADIADFTARGVPEILRKSCSLFKYFKINVLYKDCLASQSLFLG